MWRNHLVQGATPIADHEPPVQIVVQEDADVDPGATVQRPTLQDMHVLGNVAISADDQVPALQFTHEDAAEIEDHVPAAHSVQLDADGPE